MSLFRRRNTEPADPRPWRVRIADWIEQHECDPEHASAPSWVTLAQLVDEGLVVRHEIDGEPAWWALTPLGLYEISRQRAGGAPPRVWF